MTRPAPVPPPADDKDWTWVLDRSCPECGFDVRTYRREETGDRLRANVDAWVEVLGHDRVHDRPDPDHWSALEYGGHVRDVYRIYRERLRLMLTEDGPHYPNWDQNRTAVDDRYDLADPAVVAAQLRSAGEALAADFDAVSADQWDRSGFRSDGAAFTVETFARYFLHDPVHHLHDVDRGFRQLG